MHVAQGVSPAPSVRIKGESMQLTDIEPDDKGSGFHFYVLNAAATDGAKVSNAIVQAALYGQVAWMPSQTKNFAQGHHPGLKVMGPRAALETILRLLTQGP